MTIDLEIVLNSLVRSRMWSKRDSLLKFRRIVLDVDSVVDFLYRMCIDNHIKRQKSTLPSSQMIPDLYSATIVDYREFSRYVVQLFDFFSDHAIEPVLVYEGKFMEAPLFGLLAAGFTKNTQKVVELIANINDYDQHHQKLSSIPLNQHMRPNLALNIFKTIVNLRRAKQQRYEIYVHQAFYSSYPKMVQLARDYKCPVLTNNCDFIIMDVRAGFVLFDDFWHQHIELHDLATRNSKSSSGSSKKNKSPHAQPASKIKSVSLKGKNNKSPGTKLEEELPFIGSDFHYNILFLHQHPGLNANLAISLFPLTTVDFVVRHSKSLKKLKVYPSIEFKEKDFLQPTKLESKNQERTMYKRHQMAANRLEMALTFLTARSVGMLGNLIRGEATRTNSSFDVDFRQLFYYYAAAHEFKQRLRTILKYMDDVYELNYIEQCLTNRECSGDYLLNILCVSIGHLASVNYNRFIQFEDLQTKHSAYSVLNRSKSMLMSLFCDNKTHKSENSISNNVQKLETITRYPEASLTIIDRQYSKLTEQTVTTTHENVTLDSLRPKLQLVNLSRGHVNKLDCVAFINLIFQSSDITKLAKKIESSLSNLTNELQNEKQLKLEVAIFHALFQSATQHASRDDKYFTSASYSTLIHHFEIALVNHFLFYHSHSNIANNNKAHLSDLIKLVKRQSLDTTARPALLTATTDHHTKKKVKQTSKQSLIDNNVESKQVRQLIELLNSSVELYTELNSFFSYPLPKLALHQTYNPVLIYNLTAYANSHLASDKALIKF